MNKGVVLTVLMGLMAASCSQDRVLVQQQDAPISFRTVLDRQTKAASYTATNLSSFNVTALKGSSVYIDGDDFSTDDYSVWTSAQDYFWPVSGNLDFYAYAPKEAAGNGITCVDYKTFTVTPLANTDNQKDLLFARATGSRDADGATGKMLNFRHAMSQVQVKVSNSNENFRISVGGWRLAGLDGEATFTYSGTDTDGSGTFDRALWSNNTDAASNGVAYTRQLTGIEAFTFDGVATGAQARTLTGSAIVIPQKTKASHAYSSATVGAKLKGSYIAVYMTIENIRDGSPYTTDTWCCWPVDFNLQPGYRYIYSIDLAEGGYLEDAPEANDEPTSLFFGSKISFASVDVETWGDALVPLNLSYLTFSTVNAAQTNSLSIMRGDGDDGVSELEYSTNGTTWTALNYNTPVAFGNGTDLLIRGYGFCSATSYANRDNLDDDSKYFKFGSDDVLVNCSGDVSCLIDYAYGGAIKCLPQMSQFAFLFKGCKCLASAPDLPAEELSNSCYTHMFDGCINLQNAPLLPATKLNNYCYRNMFNGCKALTVLPELPATTLTEYCYSYMFNNCSGIASANLPYDYLHNANALTEGCFFGMFNNCTGLTSIPQGFLPFATMASRCYGSMFNNCTNLTTVPSNLLGSQSLAPLCYSRMFSYCYNLSQTPVLPATVMENQCYADMFSYCTSITAAPALPATTLAASCYSYMFYHCDALTTVSPSLPATEMKPSCYNNMYGACHNVTSLPADYLPSTSLAESCYESMFDATGLVNPPVLPATTMAVNCYRYMFWGCLDLESCPALPATELAEGCYSCMFRNCIKIETPPVLPATELANACYYHMFESCSALTTAPALNAQEMKYNCYCGMFWGCRDLATVPVLSSTSLAVGCYSHMFYDCTKLPSVVPFLPATTLYEDCYSNMFHNCDSIKTVPTAYLPATTLTRNCYSHMFTGCSKLKNAPALPATVMTYGCYEAMFYGCEELTSAPDLMSESLAVKCYCEMFEGCRKLQGVKAMFTQYSWSYAPEDNPQVTENSDCIYHWLDGAGTAYIAGGGTPVFTYNTALGPTVAVSLVPAGWQVVGVTP